MDDDTIGLADYPLGTQRPELIKTLTGKKLADITLAAIVAGKIGSDDIRIAPETLLMQARIAELLGIAPDAVGVKAKTNEKMGFIGRSEGIAAMAVVMLVRNLDEESADSRSEG